MALSAILLLAAPPVLAESEAPVPGYDYDPATPGMQPPRSTLEGGKVHGYQRRIFEGAGLGFALWVDRASLNALLPRGFQAQPLEGAGNATVVIVMCSNQVQSELPDGGSVDPFSWVTVDAPFVWNAAAKRTERLFLVSWVDGSEAAADLAGVVGTGTQTGARIKSMSEEEDGARTVTYSLTGADGQSLLSVRARGPAAIVHRYSEMDANDPAAEVLRFLGQDAAGPAVRIALEQRKQPVMLDATNFQLTTPAAGLTLPQGNLRVLGVYPIFFVEHGSEFYLKVEE